MSRSSKRASGHRGRTPGALVRAGVDAGCPGRSRSASSPAPARPPVNKTTVILGKHRDHARPFMPGASLPGGRQRHRLPGQQRPDPACLSAVPHDGTIKAWTLTLAQPTNKQRSFFNGFFGTPPEARLAILRRVAGTNPPRYTLRLARARSRSSRPTSARRSNSAPTFKVEKGDIVGLTVPTWAPAFAQSLPATNVWRASREAGHLHQLDRHPPGRTAAKDRPPRDLRLQVLDGPPALHGDPGRGAPSRSYASRNRSRGRSAEPALPPLTRRRAGPAGSPGPWAAPRRWRSGSGTRSGPGGRPPRGSPRRSSRSPAPPRGGGAAGGPSASSASFR